jgi:glucokinase
LRYLKNKFGHQHRISVERIASGPGLVNVYEYLAHTYPDLVDAQLHERIMAAGELKGAVIATSPHDELCQQTMKIFITVRTRHVEHVCVILM